MDARLNDPVANGFDRLSPIWDLGVRLLPGGSIPASRVRYLGMARDRRRALIVGGGTGEFLERLLASGFEGAVVMQDLSPGMLRRARRRVERRHPEALGRVELRLGDVRDRLPGGPFDLICTHYVLDLFEGETLRRLMLELDSRLADDGIWLCSDFAPPQGRSWSRRMHRALLKTLYAAFGVTCSIVPRDLPPIEPEFARLGLEALERSEMLGGLLWSAGFRKRAWVGD